MKQLLSLAVLLVNLCFLSVSHAAETVRVLIVVGPSNHPPGTHEVAAGGRLLKFCLENMSNLPGIKVDLTEQWPEPALRDSADSVVFLGDTFPPNRLPNAAQNLRDLEGMMRRGCGIVCVHYATGLLGEDVEANGDHPLLRWAGGYFANRSCPHHESFAKIFPSATIEPEAPQHPIWRGCHAFTLHDEPYTHNYFGSEGNRPASNVTILASSMLPPEHPQRESVAWCIERADQGRGMAVVMPHFYRNWSNEDLRRFILNGIIWTARLEVPAGGVKTTLPELTKFQPAAVEPATQKPKPTEPKKEAESKKVESSRIDLSHWKLTLPIPDSKPGQHQTLELSAEQLSRDNRHSDYFRVDSDGSLVFWCPVDGVHTKNTQYPRTELREVINPADDNVCWPATGQHILSATCRVLEVPSSEKVIIGQIHGQSGKALPLIKLQYHKGRIDALVKTSIEKDKDTKLTFPLKDPQQDIQFEIRLEAGHLHVTVNSATQSYAIFEKEPEWSKQSLYFKAGAYVQDNTGPSTEGARVVFTSLAVQHGQ